LKALLSSQAVSPAFTIMSENFTRVNEDTERARQQAGTQLESIKDLITCLEHAEGCDDASCGADCPHDEEDAREAIIDSALSVEVRTDWHGVGAAESCKPTDYKILLCWGGPAVQIIGTLDAFNQPDRARLQFQDWFTEWTDYPLTHEDAATVLKYAQQFYFDQ
jgi:hypothetical protein